MDEPRKEVDNELQKLQEDIERHGFYAFMNVADMINTRLGYVKYCVPVPAFMAKELGVREA